MCRAIGFAIVFLLAPGTSNAQELGVGVFAGYSIPGDGRAFGDLNFRNDSGFSAHIDFHHTQAGLLWGGDVFFRIEQADMGIGTVVFSSDGISGSLLFTKARREALKSRDFRRSFRAAFAFFRCRAITDSPLTPYLGAGIGIHGLRESEPTKYSNWEKGLFLQVVSGGEVRIKEGFSSIFAEIRVNFAGLDDDPELGDIAFATLTVAIGLRFAY